jgi:hypothetical protein
MEPVFGLDDQLKPKTEEELSERADFLVAALALWCSHALKTYIDHCGAKETERTGVAANIPFNQSEFDKASKELLTLSIWLTLLEQTGTIPDWFKQFIGKCHDASNRLLPEPNSREISARYDFSQGILALCDTVSFHICMQMNLGTTSDDALIKLGNILSAGQKQRTKLLNFALTEPVSILSLTVETQLAEF